MYIKHKCQKYMYKNSSNKVSRNKIKNDTHSCTQVGLSETMCVVQYVLKVQNLRICSVTHTHTLQKKTHTICFVRKYNLLCAHNNAYDDNKRMCEICRVA